MPRVPQGRITLRGYLAQGKDIWTTSFATDPLSAKSQSQLGTIAQQTATLWRVHFWEHGDIRPRFNDGVAFTGVRVDDIQDPGGIVRSAEFDLTEPSTGSGTASSLPTECSVCVSLRTTLPGPRHRGRMYLPPLQSDQLAYDGSLGGGAQTDIADQMAAFFTAFNGDGTVALTAFVASDAAQQLTAITSVHVGSVMDAQRRRRNAIPEAYVIRTVIP